ncbi:ankyrin repeat domain-containing protein 13C-like [Saccostrea echinata]|uniref:ankyrin repeat domain-containing protein 13C-like n=1 Tax=Saccostrea echinata TaxID=191078 RepID=UPI002A83B6E6|nr:ankyrin repeat domain-containing protein 13C-like [Saccostrea echinata]
MADWEGYPLHECVFHNDIRKLSQLLRVNDVALKDMHGNTALHLAVMLGRKDCIQLLLAHGAPVRMKNLQGWTPLAESISYGSRQTILCLLKKLKQQSRETLEERRPALIQALKDIGDFYVELKWDFQSWVPLVSRILPSDVCKIHKKGSCLRLDTTLVDFNDMRWERGDITFVFDGDAPSNEGLTVLDNKLHVYQKIRSQESEQELEDEVDILMSSDIMAAQMSTKRITFSRAQSGWLFREDKTERVGEFEADFYAVNGLILDSRKRREHLSPDDVQKNKAMMENLTKGNWNNCEFQRRPSLPSPEETNIKWEDYTSEPPGNPPCLGRPWIAKGSTKSFKATVAMSKNFPMSIEVLLDVLEVIAPFKQFQKLREFMTTKLPDGFPVKIEIPVFPTVTAKVTFTSFEWRDDIDDSMFLIPPNFREDPNRFPDL